ncbi:MAG: hypothetical protein JXB23_15060 [Candidatus Aminicenantes bacterium]|nr:hypothetical protein [Candidatus Aminicenantes bacterium]
MTRKFDFCVATDWEYDRDFVELLKDCAFRKYGLTTYIVEPSNLPDAVHRFSEGSLSFGFLYDRGSDTSPEFLELNELAARDDVPVLDSVQQLKWASDKATMHLEFIANGLMTPYTIIIPPYQEQAVPDLCQTDLNKLGASFIIKPANTTGGGIGVFQGAETLRDVLGVRREFSADKYLLQERVKPVERDGKSFWFRGFFCCGFVECSWWDPLLHIYEPFSPGQRELYRLEKLFSAVEKIARIIKLNFFSTEIALNEREQFVVVDYVNEICDMRLKSKHRDGVPDQIVNRIVEQIVDYVQNNKKGGSRPY